MPNLILQATLGTLKDFDTDLSQDTVILKWYECNRKILHKATVNGRNIVIKRLEENQPLHQEDVLYKDDDLIIWVEIEASDCIVLKPNNLSDMAKVCYEIGNKHIPLFMENNELLLPYENPIFIWLEEAGFKPFKERRILDHALRNTLTTEHHHHEH
ncbi:urease accessory protein UreE [Neisseriaceae bacterium PsAf]|nr:urease accessory protein UreE [Neisseriaceae bacterium PsAf]